jgi:hypothetical protein
MDTERRSRVDLFFIGKCPAYFGDGREPIFKNVKVVKRTKATIQIEYVQRGKVFKDTFPLTTVIVSEWEETVEGAKIRAERTEQRKKSLAEGGMGAFGRKKKDA